MSKAIGRLLLESLVCRLTRQTVHYMAYTIQVHGRMLLCTTQAVEYSEALRGWLMILTRLVDEFERTVVAETNK